MNSGGYKMVIGKLEQRVAELKAQLDFSRALNKDLQRQIDEKTATISGCERCRSILPKRL